MSEKTLAIARTIPTVSPQSLATYLSNLGGAYCDLSRFDDAERLYKEALSIEEPILDENDPSTALTYANLAGVYVLRKEFDKAEPLMARYLEISKKAFGQISPEHGLALQNLSSLYSEWERISRSPEHRRLNLEYQSSALQVISEVRGPRHPSTAHAIAGAAVDKADVEHWVIAASEMTRSVAIFLSLDMAAHPDTELRFQELIYYLDKAGQRGKVARITENDLSDILAVVRQIEIEHRVWVQKDSKNRHFGPPSPITGAKE